MSAGEDAAARGREQLASWRASRPENLFDADRELRALLPALLGGADEELWWTRYRAFGEACAGVIPEGLEAMRRGRYEPRLERYDGIGRRVERVSFHPAYHTVGEALCSAGALSTPGVGAAELVLSYLLCQNGEAGHACPAACAAGLAKLLEKVGGDELKAWLLPRLRDPDYASRWQASQFLTEVQGGSDVGANAVVARPRGDGSYELHGEKWFCSVANADVFLMTARLEGGAEGTAGLGAFVVPRLDEQGAPNGFAIRRLKDKLGTRHMASAEIDFSGARGWPLGPLEEGFKNIVEVVLTTSRVYNAVSCAGIMRGAELEAFAYAHAREAFGRPIVSFPLVQRSLARIKVTRCAALASSFALARLGERLEAGAASADEGHAFRALVGMNKLVTALRATTVVHEAMEVLGGNGAIEEFSILPTLYRDCYVLEAWEGTHNVLCAQLLRDLRRYGLHAGLLRWMRGQLSGSLPAPLRAVTERLAEQVEALEPAFARVLEADRAPASVMIRDLGERMMLVAQGLWLLEAARAVDVGCESEIPVIYEHFVRTELLAEDLTEDPGSLARMALLSHAPG